MKNFLKEIYKDIRSEGKALQFLYFIIAAMVVFSCAFILIALTNELRKLFL